GIAVRSPRPPRLSRVGQEPRCHRGSVEPSHGDELLLRGLPAHDFDASPRDAEDLGEEAHELLVRRAVDWRRGDRDLERVTARPRDAALLRARLRADLEANGPVLRLGELDRHDADDLAKYAVHVTSSLAHDGRIARTTARRRGRGHPRGAL